MENNFEISANFLPFRIVERPTKTVTDEKIKQYFLGKLDETESFDFEFVAAQNAELTEQAQLVESELIEAYLRGGLAENDRNLFEKNYLITESRREKLKFAESFLNSFKAQTIIEPQVSIWQSITNSFQLRLKIFGRYHVFLLTGDQMRSKKLVLWLILIGCAPQKPASGAPAMCPDRPARQPTGVEGSIPVASQGARG